MTDRPKETWRIDYPENCISYVEAFRRHYWDHGGVCRLLDAFFKDQGGVSEVCELGSGAGTNMLMLSELGYKCTGYDVNKDSVILSIERAAGLPNGPQYELLDFTRDMPCSTYDAVLSLFVPIALADMASLAHRAAEVVRPGGFFACMLLALQPEHKDHHRERKHSTEYLNVAGKHVVRFNFYEKSGRQIDYQGVYLVGDAASATMAVDVDTYDLIDPHEYLDVSTELYRHVKRERIYGKPDQCPPMTFEVLDIYQRLS